MTKYEQYLLDHFEDLYQTEADGFLWDDCCDYDEANRPTWFLFGKGDYVICGDYADDFYGVYYSGSCNPIKSFKTLKRAMKYANDLIERDRRMEEDDDE